MGSCAQFQQSCMLHGGSSTGECAQNRHHATQACLVMAGFEYMHDDISKEALPAAGASACQERCLHKRVCDGLSKVKGHCCPAALQLCTGSHLVG